MKLLQFSFTVLVEPLRRLMFKKSLIDLTTILHVDYSLLSHREIPTREKLNAGPNIGIYEQLNRMAASLKHLFYFTRKFKYSTKLLNC